jgi:hypothetical protein
MKMCQESEDEVSRRVRRDMRLDGMITKGMEEIQ